MAGRPALPQRLPDRALRRQAVRAQRTNTFQEYVTRRVRKRDPVRDARISQLRADGLTYQGIARQLQAEGYPLVSGSRIGQIAHRLFIGGRPPVKRRRFRLVSFKKPYGEYVSLLSEWKDEQGVWRSKSVRSYSPPLSPQVMAQARNDLDELRRLAGAETAPIPVGVLSEALWAGLRQMLAPRPLPAIPLSAARDLAHIAGYVAAHMLGDLSGKVAATQPEMSAPERQIFMTWLEGLSEEDQACALAYQWRT